LAENRFKTSSRYFEVRGRLRLEDTVVEELSLVDRGEDTGVQVQTRWRERRPPQAPVPAPADGRTRSLQ
jgi:general secretion pathway protein K